MRGVKFWLIGLLWAAPLAAQAPPSSEPVRVDRIDVLDTGIYEALTTGRQSLVGVEPIVTAVVGAVKFTGPADRVPARLGVRFGVRYRVTGVPEGSVAPLTAVWRVPEPGLKDAKTGEIQREIVSELQRPMGSTSVRGFRLDSEAELLPGDWTLELRFADRVLLTRTFTLYRE